MWGMKMQQVTMKHLLLAGCASLVLAGCQPGDGPFAPTGGNADGAASITGEAVSSETLDGTALDGTAVDGATADSPVTPSARSVKLVDRDVEAPEVFQVTDDALWDGRPSLGGVWVASPDAVDPERVILRNPANGKFVIGALFKRERDNPGPTLQISSDAAEALGLLAGQPGKISVTALRREEVPVEGPAANAPLLDAAESVASDAGAASVAASAAAAIDKAAADPAIPTAPKPVKGQTAAAAPAAPAGSAPATSGGSLIQIGLFSVEANARRAVEQLSKAGISAAISKETSQGKSFWSVTARGDKSVLDQIKQAGFADAYFLKR